MFYKTKHKILHAEYKALQYSYDNLYKKYVAVKEERDSLAVSNEDYKTVIKNKDIEIASLTAAIASYKAADEAKMAQAKPAKKTKALLSSEKIN